MESNREFLVACLCAEWCDTCVAYRSGFLAMAERFPRGGETLFEGVMLPHHEHLHRLLEKLMS